MESFDNQLIYALSVDSLVISRNRFVDSRRFEPRFAGLSVIDAQHCRSVTVRNNDFSGSKENSTISLVDCSEHCLEGEGECLEWLRILIRTSMKISRYILPILATAWIGSVSSRPFGDTLRMREISVRCPIRERNYPKPCEKPSLPSESGKSPPYCVSSRGGTISMPLKSRPGEHRGKTPRHSGFNNRRRWR